MREIYSFKPLVLDKKKPPRLPNSLKEIKEILDETHGILKIIDQGNLATFGTTSECSVKVQCPFCKSVFTGYHSEGCFHSETVPFDCPVCNFPSSILEKYRKLRADSKNFVFR
jgi:uncharacterized membrane protein